MNFRWLAITSLGLSSLFVAACSDWPMTAATQAETLRLGVEAQVPPFEYRDEAGELAGLDIELLNVLCVRMNVTCQWIDRDYATMIPALKDNQFDVIVPMTPSPARQREIAFTDLLYPLQSRLVARKGEVLLPTAESLHGKRIGVLRGTSREAFALERWGTAGVQIRSFALNEELIQALLAGSIDATLQDTIEISEALLKKPQGADFSFMGPAVVDPALGSGVALGIRKEDQQLRQRLNSALEAIRLEGIHREIVERYIGQ